MADTNSSTHYRFPDAPAGYSYCNRTCYCRNCMAIGRDAAKLARQSTPAATRTTATTRYCRYCDEPMRPDGSSRFGGRLCPMSQDGERPHRAY